jgi:hypothetical protein
MIFFPFLVVLARDGSVSHFSIHHAINEGPFLSFFLQDSLQRYLLITTFETPKEVHFNFQTKFCHKDNCAAYARQPVRSPARLE